MLYPIAQSDSNGGYVQAYVGANLTKLKTTFACKRGDTLQCMVTGGKPVVIGVVGRGDEQQEQIDNAQEIAVNLDAGITNDTESGTLTLSPVPINEHENARQTIGVIEIGLHTSRVNNPSDAEDDHEIANLKWVKEYVEKVLKEKGR